MSVYPPAGKRTRIVQVINDPPEHMMALAIDRFGEGDDAPEFLMMALQLIDPPPGKTLWIMDYLLHQGIAYEEPSRAGLNAVFQTAKAHPEWLLARVDDATNDLTLHPENMTAAQRRAFGIKDN
jgi:hypothetical protein